MASNPSRWGAGVALAALLLGSAAARGDAPPADTQAAAAGAGEEEEQGKGILHHVLLYLPNRVFDVFDLVRMRVRVGPGLAAQARVTELAALFLGGYTSIWVGLPGPRGHPRIPLPVGIENRAGAQLSVADATADAGLGPEYGAAEIGLGGQAVLLGLDVGIDPLEFLDLATGFLFIDLTGDDF